MILREVTSDDLVNACPFGGRSMCHTTSLLHVLFCDHAHTAAGHSGSNWKNHVDIRLCADRLATTTMMRRSFAQEGPLWKGRAKDTRGERSRIRRLSFNPSDVRTGLLPRDANEGIESINQVGMVGMEVPKSDRRSSPFCGAKDSSPPVGLDILIACRGRSVHYFPI
jgi:hypothetical protein